MTFWRVPRVWEGKTVAVMASGPSMTPAIAKQIRDAGIPSIVINTTYQLAPFADILYAADSIWWSVHGPQIDGFGFKGLKVSIQQIPGGTQRPNVPNDVRVLRNTGNRGFDPDAGALRVGGYGISGYQAIHLAAHTGAKRILLCGYDGRGGHWHGNHPEPLSSHELPLLRALPYYPELADALSALHIEVFNCTPESAIKAFPAASLSECLAMLETQP